MFLSTTISGEVEVGLQNIPNDRPVLFVGNHVYFGLDMTLIIYKVFKERGLMVRGLGHPVLFDTQFEGELQVRSRIHTHRTSICDCLCCIVMLLCCKLVVI